MNAFMSFLEKELYKRNCQADFLSFEDVEVFLERGQAKILIAGKPIETWSVIYPRKVARFQVMAHILACTAKTKKILFIDKFYEAKKNPKIAQVFHLNASGASVPKTYYAISYSKKQLENAAAYLKLPIVVKECGISCGEGVHLAKTKLHLEKTIKTILKTDSQKIVFLQEFIPNTFEYRILIMGNKIAVCEIKTRQPKEEFRNNVSLGATEKFVTEQEVRKSTRKEALRAAKIAGIDVAGVDVVEDKKGRPIIFEVNSCPAFTIDKKNTQEVTSLADYLSRCEKK
jgi:glutathione synthase/RimK-type ligase-like ATP-grasp enzyme